MHGGEDSMSSLSGQKIGFIGLGLMGRPMAGHLAQAGAEMTIFNRTREKIEDLGSEGMAIAESPRAVTEAAEMVILMVSNTAAVQDVMGGAAGVLAGVRPGRLIIDMGTTAVGATRELARAVGDAGGEYVDAPVSGGSVGARDAALTIMAGGAAAAVERARPLFEVMGSRLTHIGEVGTGQVAKSANQVIVGLTIGAVSEALYLAKRAGADPAKVRAAVKGGFADSRIMELHGQRIVDGDFTPGGTVRTQCKDMEEAVELAAELGFELPASELNRDQYRQLIDDGFGGLDHAGLYKYYDRD